MVDLSGYVGCRTLLAICGDDQDVGIVYVGRDADDATRPHCVSYGEGGFSWIKDDGTTLSGTQIVHYIICEVNRDGCVPKPTAQHFQPGEDFTAEKINTALNAAIRKPSDDLNYLISYLTPQNTQLIKILGDYVNARNCS